MALQALTAYGARDTNRALYNMEIKLEATASDYKTIVKLNEANWAKLHEINVHIQNSLINIVTIATAAFKTLHLWDHQSDQMPSVHLEFENISFNPFLKFAIRINNFGRKTDIFCLFICIPL